MELTEDGVTSNAGYAPYLDYRPVSEAEQAAVLGYAAKRPWLSQSVEERAIAHAVTHLVPVHLAEVRAHREALIEKTEKAVKERLTAEIQYWDYRAADLKTQGYPSLLDNFIILYYF